MDPLYQPYSRSTEVSQNDKDKIINRFGPEYGSIVIKFYEDALKESLRTNKTRIVLSGKNMPGNISKLFAILGKIPKNNENRNAD